MRNNTNGYIYYECHKKSEKEELIETARKSFFNWLSVLIGIFAVLSLVWCMFFRIVVIDGNSMYPTLCNGEKVIVYTFNYTPEKGDIVVAKSDDTLLVKRIIATENHQIDIDYNLNHVKIDSVILDEAYVTSDDIEGHNDEIDYPHIVEQNCLFLMGDNRNSSMDSRSKAVGDISCDDIVGKVVLRISSDYEIY